ncbi:TetR/AcrR family transcriptional regulator C-terminal domain-containing protein [Gordonia sp. VNK21]|uniref:TetR/AcrR family transcriptional regulator C-terminal domain-containing protein n=1 Tax=Gordonia sp. VNK21 TaxID=3382483 RepID=UPI0038D4DB75
MPPRKSKRGPLSRDEIIDAGLDLADEIGLEALSLHKLGARLGVSTMSLYRYIDDKDDLLDAMGDRLLTAIPLGDPTAEPWESVLRRVARDFRTAAIGHPRAAPLLLTRRLNAPTLLPIVEIALAALEELGFDQDERVHVLRTFIAYLVGTLMRETGTAPSLAADNSSLIASSEQALREAGLPHVAANAPQLALCDHEAELEYGLDLLIAAIHHKLQTKAAMS